MDGINGISAVKGGENAKASDFVDNGLIAELEREGLFRKLYP